jgi:hypothetical protein
MADQKPVPATPLSRIRMVAQAVLSLLLVVVIFWYLLHGIDRGQVWVEIAAMTPVELVSLLVIAAWNLATYALVPVTPGVGFWRTMMMLQAATAAANTVPTAGPAIGVGLTYSMLGSWGYSRSRSTTAMLVSGVWNAFVKLGLPVLALALVALEGNASPRRISAALVGTAGLVAAVVVFTLLLRSQGLADRFGLWAGLRQSRDSSHLSETPRHEPAPHGGVDPGRKANSGPSILGHSVHTATLTEPWGCGRGRLPRGCWGWSGSRRWPAGS